MAPPVTLAVRLGALGVGFLVATADAGASTIAQNSSWTVTRPGATEEIRIVAYGDSIFAGYIDAFAIARRAAPLVAAEYCAALLDKNVNVARRCESGGVASAVYNRINSATDRAFMQHSSTRVVTFEMCGNDYLQARSSFRSASGTCNYSGLITAGSNCKTYTELAMQNINTYAHPNTEVKIVSNLFYPGFDADNGYSTCTDPVNGDPGNGFRVHMRTLFLPLLAESNWWTCKYAADNGFVCADSFAAYMAPDYDSNGDDQIDSDAIRYRVGESVEDYKARIVGLLGTLRDPNLKLVNTTTSFDYIQSDDTHPTFEGVTASTFLWTPEGNVSVLHTTAGPYADGKNPHWNWNGHDRMGWALNPACPFVTPGCGDGAIDTTWLPSGTANVEACDDDNVTAGDGCSDSCAIEAGYACSGQPSICAPVCGDTLVTGPEQCDDGNPASGDGCSATCTVEPGFSCMGTPSTCQYVCGDGLVVTGEVCDDDNLAAGDGCSALCTVEIGWSCAGEPSMCAPVCGDELILGTETCDDGVANGTLPSCCSVSCSPQPLGTSCDDGLLCTIADVCNGGTTCSGAPNPCDDGNPCTTDACNETVGCTHTNNTAPCSDGSACTTNDTCAGGACLPGAPLACNDGNGCTDDTCNPATGCVSTNNTAPCSDGSACTTTDTCAGGACLPGAPLACNDGNSCTDDTCNPATGCVSTNNTAPCSDGSACTTNDTCAGGACLPGAPLACDDGNDCTDDTCNPATGCVSTNNTAPCSDGDACTTPDVCADGQCQGNPAICGDGVTQNGCGELCDDSNTNAGDGCSPSCQLETTPGCDASPTVDCRRPAESGHATLQIRNSSVDSKDSLQWKWKRGAATPKSDFGSPLSATSYQLCIYDAGSLRMSTPLPAGGVCAGKPCWKETSTGFKFGDRSGLHGVTQLALKGNTTPGKAQLQVKGKGTMLAPPTLPLNQPLTIQLRNSIGTCWEAVYSAPASLNLADRFKDKAD